MATKPSDAYDFTMGFVHVSDNYKRQFTDRWREILSNFILEPLTGEFGTLKYPYRQGRIYAERNNRIILKDPETHKAVMTYAAKMVRMLFGSRDRDYIVAKPRGWEDAPLKAQTVSRLLRYNFALRGNFRTLVEAVVDMILFGTSIIETSWHYEEREQPVRSVEDIDGFEMSTETRARIPVYDDVRLRPVDIDDFFPDPTRYRIEDMPGAAKRFRMNAIQANAEARKGLYRKDAVRRAIADIGRQTSIDKQEGIPESFRRGIDQPTDKIGYSDFRDMIGYEYWGDVPWEDDQGSSRRVITVLNNVVVRDDPWPLADSELPWKTFIINPLQGRFYGVAPAEVIRYDQDFADALKVLLAEAVIRQVHPPIAYDPDSEVDLEKVKAWSPDALIGARGGPNAVGAVRYDAQVQNGFGMMMGLKNSMQEASGAVGGIQGEPGPSREPATVGVQRVQMAMDRPELAALVLENECLPPLGESMLRLDQQFIEDTEDLKMRIGDLPESVWIGDIMGDFDVEFIGSRMGMNRQEKLQSIDRLINMAAVIPAFQAQVPWDKLAQTIVGKDLELPEIAAEMPDPQTIYQNLKMMMALGGGKGAGSNSVPGSSEPPGLMPAQVAGGVGGGA